MIMLLFYPAYSKAGTWTTIDYPGDTNTFPTGINGNNIVGYCKDNSGVHGFLYDGTNWTNITHPGSALTYVEGISGNNMIGYWNDSPQSALNSQGFIYDGTNWTTIPIIPRGIDGSNIVGGNKVYNITTQSLTTINYPGAATTSLMGISGNNIVGYYTESSFPIPHGFLYDGTNWTALTIKAFTPVGIDGSNIVNDSLLYNFITQSATTLKYPGAKGTNMAGISGNIIVGSYSSGDPYGWFTGTESQQHGFIYTIPEPATVLLLGFGLATLRKRKA
jgi:hypothetical protein